VPSGGVRRALLIVAVLVQSLSGIGGGLALLADPTGSLLGIPLAWLDESPFPDYFLPGLILFAALGIFPLFVTRALWKRRRWARAGSTAVGMALIAWIAVEVVVVGYQPDPPLQAIYGTLGVIILVLSLAARRGAPH
jgi:peptidoglycan/LPS O-acetylase OafA/YrhL